MHEERRIIFLPWRSFCPFPLKCACLPEPIPPIPDVGGKGGRSGNGLGVPKIPGGGGRPARSPAAVAMSG